MIVWKSPNLLNNGCKTGEQEMSTYVSHIKQKQFLGFNLPKIPFCHFYPSFPFLEFLLIHQHHMSIMPEIANFFTQNKLHRLKLIKRKWVYIILVIVQSLLTLNTKYTTPQSNTPSLPETPNCTNVDCLRFVRILFLQQFICNFVWSMEWMYLRNKHPLKTETFK